MHALIRRGFLLWLLVGLCGAPAYSADVVVPEGTWYLQIFQVDAGPHWLRGVISIDSGALFSSGTFHADDGTTFTPVGSCYSSSLGLGLLVYDWPGFRKHYRILTDQTHTIMTGTGAQERPYPGGVEIMPFPEAEKSLVTGIKLDPAGYTQPELAGTWALFGMDCSSSSNLWLRGQIGITAAGAMSGSVVDRNGLIIPLSGDMNLASSGVITTTINATWIGALSMNRDVVFATQQRGPGRLEMDAMVRLSGPYDVAQLPDRVSLAAVMAPSGGRAEGVVRFADNGDFRSSQRRPHQPVEITTGTLEYTPDGFLHVVGDTFWAGACNPDRSVMVGASNDDGADFFVAMGLPPATLEWLSIKSPAPDQLALRWWGAYGEQYCIEEHADPTAGGAWTSALGCILGTWTDPNEVGVFMPQEQVIPKPTADFRSYRVGVDPLP